MKTFYRVLDFALPAYFLALAVLFAVSVFTA